MHLLRVRRIGDDVVHLLQPRQHLPTVAMDDAPPLVDAEVAHRAPPGFTTLGTNRTSRRFGMTALQSDSLGPGAATTSSRHSHSPTSTACCFGAPFRQS